eukprot:5309086-Amphidinium_carterae.1
MPFQEVLCGTLPKLVPWLFCTVARVHVYSGGIGNYLVWLSNSLEFCHSILSSVLMSYMSPLHHAKLGSSAVACMH